MRARGKVCGGGAILTQWQFTSYNGKPYGITDEGKICLIESIVQNVISVINYHIEFIFPVDHTSVKYQDSL